MIYNIINLIKSPKFNEKIKIKYLLSKYSLIKYTNHHKIKYNNKTSALFDKTAKKLFNIFLVLFFFLFCRFILTITINTINGNLFWD